MALVSFFLTELCAYARAGHPPGAVYHWTDNESICAYLLYRQTKTRASWRERSSKDLWAEIIGRIRYWCSLGGQWCTSWVRSHVDSDQTRSEESWTCAERLNIEADRIATLELDKAPLNPLPESSPQLGTDLMGGSWYTVKIDPSFADCTEPMLDSFSKHFTSHVAAKSFMKYWTHRVKSRNAGKSVTVSAPHLDNRLSKTNRRSQLMRSKWDVFRSKLWWDHLPSMWVRNRGSSLSTEDCEHRRCDLCGEKSQGTTWHILGRCTNPELILARHARSQQKLRQALDETFHPLLPASKCYRNLLDALSMEGDCWTTPTDWEDEVTRAGEASNPWYGLLLFPASWLDDWHEEGDGSYSHWSKGVVVPQKTG